MPDTRSATPGPRRAAWLLAPGARSYLMASALFVVAFAIIPFSIYADSGDDKHGPAPTEIRIEDQTDLPFSKLTVLGVATDP